MEESRLRTQSIVEGGIIAGIGVVLCWISYFIFPVIFLCSLPFAFLSYRWEWKVGFISLMVTLIILFFFISPTTAFFLYFPSGILGIVLGWGIRKDLPLGRIFLYGTLINFTLEIVTVLLTILLFKIPFEKTLGLDLFKESYKNSFNFLSSFFKGLDLSNLETLQKQFFEVLNIIIPSILFLSSFLQVVLNYWIIQKVFLRFKWNIKPLPSIDSLRVPKKIWNFLFLLTLSSFILSFYTPIGVTLLQNFSFLLQFSFFLEGFFVLWSLLKRSITSNILRIMIVILFLFNPILSIFLFIIGIIDIFYPIRERVLR